ncbi:uncharacterized protein [Ptychodera flava]|uniref:uncharacterized protein n=1 Tax=Ptychodera flava TaxID=63121 RepID=UPI00396A9A14
MLPFDMSHHLKRSSWGLSLLFSLFGSSSSEDKTAYRFLCSAEESSPFSERRGDGYILHSQKVMNGFHSVLQRAVNSIGFDDMEVWIGKDGPAMKVMAKYRDTDYSQQYLKIDLVPAVKDGDRYYVAKPNKYDTSEGAIGKWRVSFSDQEKAKIYRAGERKGRF